MTISGILSIILSDFLKKINPEQRLLYLDFGAVFAAQN